MNGFLQRVVIARRLRGSLRYWDGVTHQHSFALPRFIREALAAETRVVTDAEPEGLSGFPTESVTVQ